MNEFEIRVTANFLQERDEWELKCRGCKHLGKTTWCFCNMEKQGYRCEHPDRQSGFSDPRPYGCGGYRYEKR